MTYKFDIFVSYRRTETIGGWVKNHLVPRLQLRLNEIAPRNVEVFCDFKMADGVNFPAELRNKIKASGLLLSIWSADYFRSTWCMAEWVSFRERQKQLGLFTDDHTQGLVYPIRYSDGDYFHPEAKIVQYRKDFSQLNYPDEAFRNTPKYLEFDDLVKQVAEDLVARLNDIPAWRADFPIAELPVLEPTTMQRPVI
ncbi:toll/interleukin-1 receptor domain-containing protein [Nitrosomonas oligotropha]|uniref:toll/interleukin-1 receptor domain-containing protein n=1 Tax=Nitrosomonas oligotropha TaxID=42354 RepID=UPI00136D6076|nr:toll/interleukin-1 receptor domain-containing protein [Nitrosomonas oligotropha]MXS82931.1 TIR domain-containing protein [Nitrosomonas oligotropha]